MEYLDKTKGKPEIKKGSKGFVSLLILLFLTVLAWMGLKAYFQVNNQGKITKYEAQKTKAVYLAEGGIEWAIACLENSSSWEGGKKCFLDGNVEVTVIKTAKGYRVVSLARSGSAQRKIQADLEDSGSKLIISRYEELHN